MNDVLFLIVALLLLSMITGLRILIDAWGEKYRYKSSWELLFDEEPLSAQPKKRKVRRYGR